MFGAGKVPITQQAQKARRAAQDSSSEGRPSALSLRTTLFASMLPVGASAWCQDSRNPLQPRLLSYKVKASHLIDTVELWSMVLNRNAANMLAGGVPKASTGCSPTG